ncbi:hypothetical protein EXIGLDRAFT_766277 [Exidia glandulosa HHB12029]|uniref:Uncharacterized protein n=1 Tax=Exidia glandulosa HHB12029 TaxID=1314781 RepID=A0A165JUU4_EXIGL|nr:hypothetical protein EXIGLDRAFT_766277 [Exidia glandulosa HHB12029]
MPTPTSPAAPERRHTVQELQIAIRLRWYVDRGVLEDDPCARLELKREIEKGKWTGQISQEVDDADIIVVDAATVDPYWIKHATAYVITYDYFVAARRMSLFGKDGIPALSDYCFLKRYKRPVEPNAKVYVDISAQPWRFEITSEHFDAEVNIVDPALADLTVYKNAPGIILACDYFYAAQRLRSSGKVINGWGWLDATSFALFVPRVPVVDVRTYGPRFKLSDATQSDTRAASPSHGTKRIRSCDKGPATPHGPSAKRARRGEQQVPSTRAVNPLLDTEDEEDIEPLPAPDAIRHGPGEAHGDTAHHHPLVPLPPAPTHIDKGFAHEKVLTWILSFTAWVKCCTPSTTFTKSIAETSSLMALFDLRWTPTSFANFVKYTQNKPVHKAIFRKVQLAYDTADRAADYAHVLGPQNARAAVEKAARQYKNMYPTAIRSNPRRHLRPCPKLKDGTDTGVASRYTAEGKEWLKDAVRFFVAGGAFPSAAELADCISSRWETRASALGAPGRGALLSMLTKEKKTWITPAYDDYIRGRVTVTSASDAASTSGSLEM